MSIYFRLVCGDIESNFDAVFNKVRTLSSKTNFSFLLCVGNFFGESAGTLEDYKKGSKKGNEGTSKTVNFQLRFFCF